MEERESTSLSQLIFHWSLSSPGSVAPANNCDNVLINDDFNDDYNMKYSTMYKLKRLKSAARQSSHSTVRCATTNERLGDSTATSRYIGCTRWPT